MYGTAVPTGPVNITGFVSIFGTPEFTPVSITPAPEPTVAVTTALGLTVVGLRRKRRSMSDER